MEAFIRNDQYNLIKRQVKNLVNGHAAAQHEGVLKALKEMTEENVIEAFTSLTEEQRQLLSPVTEVENKEQGEKFLNGLKRYVIPFNKLSEQTLKKLFPKAKKLKLPDLESMDLREISYLAWNDQGSSKMYLVANHHQKLIGVQGTFKYAGKKGICTICHGYEEIGLFSAEVKGADKGTFKKRGNYICRDSEKCNLTLTSLDKLHDFISRLNQ
ncbi:FusB/FusC family EF-G-binding protein [Pseudobacillus badius]|uniref:FusB/FusC family EF-G-binding protein n=1 Tax=Bacillus badius TaxID=1455 RepID=UPI0007B080C5|nr:FusB/FusC family EF-G-binding protein [Bacillus badius]KZO00787.1 elongation factor G-binding protein [Bacillus badius]MED0666977.1 FusB/FusC family EF-G-binding protein [Bacillus badius]OCS88195.1 elongation factor G-binding protein [Bacillus badius]OVE53276.1 elongation factor G-binding protein [Bacillus badius]TDW05611.1 treble-clef zinc-finger protein [Bacillus badius]